MNLTEAVARCEARKEIGLETYLVITPTEAIPMGTPTIARAIGEMRGATHVLDCRTWQPIELQHEPPRVNADT